MAINESNNKVGDENQNSEASAVVDNALNLAVANPIFPDPHAPIKQFKPRPAFMLEEQNDLDTALDLKIRPRKS